MNTLAPGGREANHYLSTPTYQAVIQGQRNGLLEKPCSICRSLVVGARTEASRGWKMLGRRGMDVPEVVGRDFLDFLVGASTCDSMEVNCTRSFAVHVADPGFMFHFGSSVAVNEGGSCW